MNNENIRNHYDAFGRIDVFGSQHSEGFAAAGRARAQFAIITAVVAAMEVAGVKKLSGTGDIHGVTDAKAIAAQELRVTMRAIRGTAEAISEEEGLPEFDDQFRCRDRRPMMCC